METLCDLLDRRRSGFSLPRELYLDDAIFKIDLEAVFSTDWLFVCNLCEIKQPGDFVTIEIGNDSLVILRDHDGEVRAFHNTCRHRGSRICTGEKGHANRLVCPYHQWVYNLDGRLIHARRMPATCDLDAHGLALAKVEVVCNMVYVSIAENPPPLDRFRDTVTPYIAPHQPDRTKVVFTSSIIEEANWKLVIENNLECYHCDSNHPELMATLTEFVPDTGSATAGFQTLMNRATSKWDRLGLPHRPADGGNEFRCLRLPLDNGAVSFTMDGDSACNKLLGNFTDPELGSVRMFRVPNNWNHFLSDHIIHFRVLPLAVDRTMVRTTWLVHEDAIEGVDYDIDRLTRVWIATNDQDRRLAENNHRGIRSSAYRPGPFAPTEFMLNSFTNWYAQKLEAYAYASSSARRLVAAE